MAFRFVAVVAALACINMAAANPHAFHGYPHAPAASGCPKPPLPEIVPTVVQTVIPGPVNIGPEPAGVIEHISTPYEINYFGKPWVVKHGKSAAVNVFGQTPAVVDEYAAPAFGEAPAPPAVVVEPVCGGPLSAVPGAGYAAYPGYGAHAPAPVYPAPVGKYGCH